MRGRAAVVAATLLVAACGTASSSATPSASPSGAPSGTPAVSPAPEVTGELLYFVPDYETEDGRNGGLVRLEAGADEAVPALPGRFAGRAVERYDWSPDGARFVFAAWDPPDAPYDPASTLDLWVADRDGANATLVFDCAAPCWLAGGPAWSPDGGRIAFGRGDAVDGEITASAVQVLDLASGEVETVLEAVPPDTVGVADWAPDGRRLLVGQARLRSTKIADLFAPGPINEEAGLAVLDLATPGGSLRPLPRPEVPVGNAAWHPTDDLVVFDAGAFNNPGPAHSVTELYVVRADGTGLAQLTDAESVGASLLEPSWAPDGSTILATLWHRASYTPTLARVAPDSGAFDDLGSSRIVGLSPRQRPGTAAP